MNMPHIATIFAPEALVLVHSLVPACPMHENPTAQGVFFFATSSFLFLVAMAANRLAMAST